MVTYEGELARLARDHGIQTAYTGIDGRVSAGAEALRATLDLLGVPVPANDLEAVKEARRRSAEEKNDRLIEPVVVMWDGEGTGVPLNPRVGAVRGGIAHLELEDGTRREVAVSDDGARLELREPLPLGYHRLRFPHRDGEEASTLIVAPRRAHEITKRPETEWGLFAPTYAMSSRSGFGCGDFGDLDALMRWVASLGGRTVGTLPLFSSFLDTPFEPSPYSPVSRLFWNELFIDPTDCEEWRGSPETRTMFSDRSFQALVSRLREAELVDYRQVMATKRRVLSELARVCEERLPLRFEALQRYLADNPMLSEYARFRARVEETGSVWPDWPPRERGGDLTECSAEGLRYHAYVQWIAETQLTKLASSAEALGCGLYLDLPLGAHPHGFDVFREQSNFALDCSVGAPPDRIFSSGQDWGFPPLHPERSRRTGHAYWRACVRKQLQVSSIARIDHVMGLHRLYWIPRGADKAEGVYVRYPADELYAILTLESHRNRCRLVGENLGIVPSYVNRALTRHRIRKTFVLQYALRRDPVPIDQPPTDAVASMNTHDTATFGGFWRCRDIDDLLTLGLLDDSDASLAREHRDEILSLLTEYLKRFAPSLRHDDPQRALELCLGWLMSSRAELVMVTLEDLWGEERPQNIPGSVPPVKNWQRKFTRSLEAIVGDPDLARRLRDLSVRVQE